MSLRFVLPSFISACILLFSCSKKAEQNADPAPTGAPDPETGIFPAEFAWGVERGPMVTFYYQPTDSLRMIARQLLNKTIEVYGTISAMLGYQNPEPIEFYCYKDIRTLEQYTSRKFTFNIGNKFYYGYGPVYGRNFAEFVISKIGESKFAFIREGIPLLFDYSGRNYHHSTNNFLADGLLTPVAELTDNISYAQLREQQRQVEAASLCAFIFWEWGPPSFEQIYHSDKDFATALRAALDLSVEELENKWHRFLPEHTVEKEEERERTARETGR